VVLGSELRGSAVPDAQQSAPRRGTAQPSLHASPLGIPTPVGQRKENPQDRISIMAHNKHGIKLHRSV